MNPDPLDDLLRAYSKEAMPAPSNRLQSDVWREIEARRTGLSGFRWSELMRRPRLSLAAAGIALVAGILPAAATGSASLRAQRVRDSLQLEVFSADIASVVVAATRPGQR